MVHKDFVKWVQKSEGALPLLVDFDTAQYNVETGTFHQVIRGRNNSQFLSVKGSTRQAYCYSAAHTNMPLLFENQVRIPIVGGVQIVHSQNIFTAKSTGKEIQVDLQDYGLK